MKKILLAILSISALILGGYLYVSNANKCGELCERDFWKYAQAEDVKALIEAGADVNRKNEDGQSPLYRAAGQGDAASIMLLLEAGAKVNYNIGKLSQPLHESIGGSYEQKADNVAALIAAGALIDARSPSGATALHTAAGNPSTQIVLMLIDAGADVNIKITREGYYNGNTPLHSAVLSGNPDNFAILVEHGANKDAQNAAGSTPLHLAAHAGGIEKINALLALNVDGTILDNDDKTPFDLVAEKENSAGTPAYLALQLAANK